MTKKQLLLFPPKARQYLLENNTNPWGNIYIKHRGTLVCDKREPICRGQMQPRECCRRMGAAHIQKLSETREQPREPTSSTTTMVKCTIRGTRETSRNLRCRPKKDGFKEVVMKVQRKCHRCNVGARDWAALSMFVCMYSSVYMYCEHSLMQPQRQGAERRWC